MGFHGVPRAGAGGSSIQNVYAYCLLIVTRVANPDPGGTSTGPGGVAMSLGRTTDGLGELRFPRWIERRRLFCKWLTLTRRNNYY
eukprot:scaffold34612_cov80-Skeletonema_marinoi.AAC.1